MEPAELAPRLGPDLSQRLRLGRPEVGDDDLWVRSQAPHLVHGPSECVGIRPLDRDADGDVGYRIDSAEERQPLAGNVVVDLIHAQYRREGKPLRVGVVVLHAGVVPA